MATYRYEAFNAQSTPQRGTVEASTEAEAGEKLRAEGLFLQRIELDSPEPMKTVLRGETPGDRLVKGKPREGINGPTGVNGGDRSEREPLVGVTPWPTGCFPELRTRLNQLWHFKTKVLGENLADTQLLEEGLERMIVETAAEMYRDAFDAFCLADKPKPNRKAQKTQARRKK